MTKRPPPVPPQNCSDKGPAAIGTDTVQSDTALPDPKQRNLAQQGRQGNIKQNTRHQGYQQNR